VREGLKQCLSMKRRDDLWRIDRYSIEINPHTDEKASPESIFPYDDSLMTPELKAAHGCISDPDLMGKALAHPAPRDRAAADPIAAFQRQCDAFAKRGGKRHIFLYLHDMSGFDLKQDAAIERLKSIAQESSIVLHCICPDVAGQWALLRELCLSNPEGSFTEAKLDGMVDGLVDAYANLCSRFEISYSFRGAAEPSQEVTQPSQAVVQPSKVKLKISSDRGRGESEVPLDTPAPPPPPAPDPASVPAPEAPVQPA